MQHLTKNLTKKYINYFGQLFFFFYEMIFSVSLILFGTSVEQRVMPKLLQATQTRIAEIPTYLLGSMRGRAYMNNLGWATIISFTLFLKHLNNFLQTGCFSSFLCQSAFDWQSSIEDSVKDTFFWIFHEKLWKNPRIIPKSFHNYYGHARAGAGLTSFLPHFNFFSSFFKLSVSYFF